MRFEIHFEYMDGTTDNITLSGDSLEEIRQLAQAEVDKRNPADCWSEQVE